MVFDPTVNAGNLISMAVFLVGLGVFVATTRVRLDSIEKQLAKIDNVLLDMLKISNDVKMVDQRLSSQLERIDDRVTMQGARLDDLTRRFNDYVDARDADKCPARRSN